MTQPTPADDFAAGAPVPEPAPVEVHEGERVELFELGDDGEAGALAASEAGNYEQAQADYTPIAEVAE